jgi:preprotein translocase subunit YajC
VAKIDENFVGLEVANNVEVRIQRSAIVQVLPKNTLK